MNQEQTWKPIATAPKDGREIIVGYGIATEWIVHNAFWIQWEDWMEGTPEEETGWWSYIQSANTRSKLDGCNAPTHWIELPERPSLESIHGVEK